MEPSGRGLYALASLAATACALVLGSVWTANAIELAKGRTGPQELRGASLVIAAVGGGLIAAAAIAFSLTLGDRWWVVAFPAATTPFLLLSRYQQGLLQSLGRVHAVNMIMLSRVLTPLLFITPALLAGMSDRGAIGIWTLSLVLIPVLPLVTLHRVLGPVRIPRDRALYTFVSVQAERPGTVAVIAMLSIALTVITTFILVPVADAPGAAIASSVSAAVAALATFHIYSRESGERATIFVPGPAEARDYMALGAAIRGFVSRTWRRRSGPDG